MAKLIDLFMQRHAEIELRLEGKTLFDDMPGDYFAPRSSLNVVAKRLLNQALGLADGNFSSWIPTLPLAAMLSARRRMTVDLAPQFLENFRRNYGIPERAMLAFGAHKLLLFNIRDFDPRGSDVEERAAEYEPYRPLIEAIFELSPDSIFFLATLRDRLFDALPGSRAGKQSLRTFHAEAGQLESSANAAAELPTSDPMVQSLRFRGERVAFRAVRWHWAYINAMERFIDPELLQALREDFERLASSSKDSFVAGTSFLSFANRLRYLHLLNSAPLSAAFGGVYNFSLENEYSFVQAVERGARLFDYDYASDDLIDLIYDLQLGRLRNSYRQFVPDKLWESLKYLGIRSYCRVGSASHFDHYSDQSNIDELIAYFEMGADSILSFAELEAQMDTLLGRGGDIAPRDLIDLAASFAEGQAVEARQLNKLTEGHQIILPPSSELPSRYESVITETNPKAMNLIFSLLKVLGLKSDFRSKIGSSGDFSRRTYHAFQMFRNPPS